MLWFKKWMSHLCAVYVVRARRCLAHCLSMFNSLLALQNVKNGCKLPGLFWTVLEDDLKYKLDESLCVSVFPYLL